LDLEALHIDVIMCDEVRLVDGGDDFPLLRVWKKGYGYIDILYVSRIKL
jgi:hypothetical protein